MAKVIILYGEMGAGKNYRGERHAEAFGMKFLDGDLALPEEMEERVKQFKPLTEAMLDRYVHTHLFGAILGVSGWANGNPQDILVAQALYRRKNRDKLRAQLEEVGFEVEMVQIRVPFFQHMRQLWSRPQGFLWVLYGLMNKPFFEV